MPQLLSLCSRAWEPQLLSPHAQLLKPIYPRACAAQQEKPLQGEATHHNSKVAPTCMLHHSSLQDYKTSQNYSQLATSFLCTCLISPNYEQRAGSVLVSIIIVYLICYCIFFFGLFNVDHFLKVFIEFVSILLLFHVLFWLRGM